MTATFKEMKEVLTFLQAKGATGQSLGEIATGTGLPAHKVKDAIMHYTAGRSCKIVRSGRYFRHNTTAEESK
jgi:hypothetical protein